MRLRNVKNAVDIVEKSPYVIKEEKKYRGKFRELFKNDNPINIEIGMGKGDFVIGMALLYPNINFIGIEKYESVMVRAIQKLENMDIPNLRLIRMDASLIADVFDREIDTIYLNFSDPWPKVRHAKRRLTSPNFLENYENIFKGNPHIIQKTDNTGLFAYSLMSLSKNGYILENISLDLANTDIPNVCTEYEKKFMSMGVKINYCDAVKYEKK
ncbi:MAG: tRNA (guanosine(46)-N7)-methyltransferase TrmB [Bacilli bacterium]|nr:tRNA (guanosine(46)-N7)-methyltransferase TrmB [Bacilli bacterium]